MHKMRYRCSIYLVPIGRVICFIFIFTFNLYGQNEILKTKLVGSSVQPFGAPDGEFIDSFTVHTDGDYKVLTACSATDAGDIFQTKLKGTFVQAFTPASGHIDSFATTVSGDTVYLLAHSSNGETGAIFKSVLVGTGVQAFGAPAGEYIDSLGVTGPDADGYLYLLISSTVTGIFELTGFSAILKNDFVLLKWRTEAEKESYQWLIQRKEMDGVYVTIGTLKAQGNVSQPTDYRYEDRNVKFGNRYLYQLIEVDMHNKCTYFGPIFVDLRTSDYIPQKMLLYQNFPNPFAGKTGIRFGIPYSGKDAFVSLAVYDLTGRVIRTLISKKAKPGYHFVNWDGKDENGEEVTNGVFFYRLNVGSKNIAKKMLYLK